MSDDDKNLPNYLSRFDCWIGDVNLDCWVDFEPADRSVGYAANAHLVHAIINCMDVVDLLSDHVKDHIETEAAEYLDQ